MSTRPPDEDLSLFADTGELCSVDDSELVNGGDDSAEDSATSMYMGVL